MKELDGLDRGWDILCNGLINGSLCAVSDYFELFREHLRRVYKRKRMQDRVA